MKTPHEKNNNYSASYDEVVDYYQQLESSSEYIHVKTWGKTDFGEPLRTVVLSKQGVADPQQARAMGKTILLINNGIHPGEPCGIDASMALTRDLVLKKEQDLDWSDLVIVIIPVYNIGGAKNRNTTSRANQAGPSAYGFRGNSRNYDLNRDFIKCDSKNAQTFNQIFNYWSPDIFVDTHTSNGADYQYTMTLISTQKDKLEKPLHDLLEDKLEPYLYQSMKEKNWEMIPYVYARDTPDKGIVSFLDYPRYSSGYAALKHTISFMPETHMLKPFKDRVESTYIFLETMVEYLSSEGGDVQKARAEAKHLSMTQKKHDLKWKIDTTKTERLLFKGYAAKYKPSEISGLERLYYDRAEPYEKEIDFSKSYVASHAVEKPTAYIIPQGYADVIDRLKWNGVAIETLSEDQELNVDLYRIVGFKTSGVAYEGHYLHSDIKVEKTNETWPFYKGDIIVKTDQESVRYIIETMEPEAPDSFFAWNFFDGILMQKEYFSPYVFEDLAVEILKENPDLKLRLDERKANDQEFAANAHAQLRFIYENSPHFERTHNIYPVARIQKLDQVKIFD